MNERRQRQSYTHAAAAHIASPNLPMHVRTGHIRAALVTKKRRGFFIANAIVHGDEEFKACQEDAYQSR